MVTPTVEEIKAKATELYFLANPHITLNPEDSELKEGGYWQQALDIFLRNLDDPSTHATNETVTYAEQLVNGLGYRVVNHKDYELILDAHQIKEQLSHIKNEKANIETELHILQNNNKTQVSLAIPSTPNPTYPTANIVSQKSIEIEKPQYIETPIPFDLKSALATGITLVGTRQCGKTTMAMSITDLLKQHGIIVYCIDPTRVWLKRKTDMTVVTIPPISKRAEQITWQYKNTIFDTSMLSQDDQQKFTELFSMTLLNFQIQLPEPRPQIWIWLEEAHTPLPSWALLSKKLTQTKRLVTQGANFSISFGLITQFAAEVSKLPVKATQQRYFGLTSEPNDIKYLRAFIGKEWSNQLCELVTGEFIYNFGKIIKRFHAPNPKSPFINRGENWQTYSSITTIAG